MSIGVVVYHVRHAWSKYQELEVRTPAPRIFQVRFNSKYDLKEILKHVPWSLGGYLFRIHRWTPSIDYRTLNYGQKKKEQKQCFGNEHSNNTIHSLKKRKTEHNNTR